MAVPTFVSVVYTDSNHPGLPQTGQWGVFATVQTSGPAATPCLAARLAPQSQSILPPVYSINTQGGASSVLVPLTSPLQAGLAYVILLQWAPAGTDPSTLDWITPGNFSSAPVTTQRLRTIAGVVSVSNNVASVTAMAESQDGGSVQGLMLRVFDDLGNTQGTLVVSAGLSSTLQNIAIASGPNYWLYALALQPISGTIGQSGTTYSLGPPSKGLLLPVTSPTLTGVAYDGAELAVTWQPAAQLSGGVASQDAAYWLQIIRGGAVVASFPATSNGARIATTLTPDCSVAGAISIGPLTGPSSVPQPVLATPPAIAGVQLAADPNTSGNTLVSVTLSAAPPAGSAIQVQLVQNGTPGTPTAAAGTPPVAQISAALPAGGSYAVQAYFATSGPPAVSGPACAPVPLTSGAPAISSLSYDGTRVLLNWSPVAGAAVTGYQVVFSGSFSGTFTTGPATSLALPASIAPGTSFSAVVTSTGPSFVGLASVPAACPVPVLAPPPAFSECAFDGVNVWLNWSRSGGPGLDSYAVKILGLTDSGAPSPQTLTYFTRLSPGLTVALPCDAPRLWSASVTPLAGNNNGPGSGTITIVTAVATITGVTLAPGNLDAAWSIEGATQNLLKQLTAGPGSVQGMLLDGDQMISTTSVIISAATGQLSMPLPSGVNTSRLTLVTQISLDICSGPRSGPVAVLANAPGSVVANYDGQILTASWSGGGQDGVLGYTVTLTPATGAALTFTTGPETTLQAGCNLSLGTTWQVSVEPFGANTTGIASASATVVLPQLTAPAVHSAVFDGANLALQWSQPALPYLSGYLVVITPASGAPLTVSTGPETSLALPLTQATGANVTVTGVSALRNSPASTSVALLTSAPLITGVAIEGAEINITWSVTTAPAQATYIAELLDGDTVIAAVTGTDATGASIPVPAGKAAARFEVRGFITVGVTRGPTSGAVSVLLTAPASVVAGYDGQVLTASWSSGGQDGVLGYIVTLTPATGATLTFTMGPETMLQASCNLSLGTTWQVSVQPFGANTTGIASASVAVTLPPALSAPLITSAAYDGEALVLAWNPPSLPCLTGYAVTLTPSSGSAITLATGPETTLALPLALAQATGATISVTGVSALRNSPSSASVAVLTAAPLITGVVADSGRINISWSVATPPSKATYIAELLDGDTFIAVAPGTDATGASIPVPAGAAAARFRVRGFITVGLTRGPAGGAVPVLLTAPGAVVAGYDGQWLTASWSSGGQDGVLGYIVTLTPATGTALTFTTGPETTLQVSCDLSLETSWQVSVQPFGASTTGLASAGVAVASPPTLTAPEVQSAVFDGETLTLQWSQPVLPYLTGYLVAIKSTSKSPLTVSTGPETSLALPLTAGDVAGATVVIVGVSALRRSAIGALPLVTAQPLITGISLAGGNAVVAWSVGSLPAGAVATAEVLDGESVVATFASTATGVTVPLSSLAGGTRYSIRGYVGNGAARGPHSGSVAVLTTAPTLVSASYDGRDLTASWNGNGQADVLGYTLTLTPATGASFTVNTGPETAVQVACNLSPDTTWQISVQPFGANTTGAASAAVPMAVPPVFTQAGFSLDAKFNATWSATAGAVAYNVVIGNGLLTIPSQVTAPSLPATGVALPAGYYEIRVQAVLSASNASLTGPWSAPLPVFALPVANLQVSYDGRVARFSWPPVESGGVIGYQLTVLAAGAPVAPTPVSTTANQVEVALPYASGAAYSAIVQVVSIGGLGVPSQPAVPLFSPGLFFSTDPTKAPSIAPATDPTLAAQTIVIYLPELFPTPVTTGFPSTDPFVLAAMPSTPATPFAYTLTLDANSAVWTFDANPVREGVQGPYQSFLKALIDLQITPLGWQTVQDALSRVMPQTFAETLLYGYGFNPSQGCVDLRPGMILRAEYEAYQYIGPGQTGSQYIDGYVAACTAEYEVSSYVDSSAAWLTGFDAFLAQITDQGSAVPTPASQSGGTMGGGGVADFFFSQFRQPFCRIVYPTTFLDQGTDGDPHPGFNVAILAAPDYKSLQTATGLLRNSLPVGSGAAVLYLRGRATLSACIRVWVDGDSVVVPLGTTVGNLLEQRGARPPLMSMLPLNGISLSRPIGAAITDASAGTAGYPVGATRELRLDWLAAPAYGPVVDRLSLPLFHGDRLSLRAPHL
jgi:hypothetical protein